MRFPHGVNHPSEDFSGRALIVLGNSVAKSMVGESFTGRSPENRHFSKVWNMLKATPLRNISQSLMHSGGSIGVSAHNFYGIET